MMSCQFDTGGFVRFKRRGAAILFAAAVFIVDTFTTASVDLAVFYVVAMLIAARGEREREIAAFGGFTAALAIITFAVTRGRTLDGVGALGLAGALTAIGVTSWLLVRHAADRRALIEAESDPGEWRHAQAELARASRAAAVGAVSASIAHEINQPLGAVVMNGQTCLRYLRRDTPDIESAIAAAERVVHEGHRASEIVRQTRELIAKRRTRDERMSLDTLIKETVSLLDRDIETIRAEVTLVLPAQSLWLVGDRVALQQALINLIGNALNAVATQPCGKRRLTIGLILDDNEVLISVHDSGPGIAVEHLHRIFDPFFTTKEGGMGMGLAISRSAIEAHGGTLTVRNEKNGGAIFECKVPLRGDQSGRSSEAARRVSGGFLWVEHRR